MKCKFCDEEVKISNSSPVWNLLNPSKGYDLACKKCTKNIPHICPERSKREDPEKGCGALNSMET